MWMFCSAGISNSVSRGARPSQQPAGGSPTDLWRPARKLFTHWKILNKYFVFLSVAKLDLTLSKHSMVGVVSEECVLCLIDGWSDGRVWMWGQDVPPTPDPHFESHDWSHQSGMRSVAVYSMGARQAQCVDTQPIAMTQCHTWHPLRVTMSWHSGETTGTRHSAPGLSDHHTSLLRPGGRGAPCMMYHCRPVATLLCAMVTLAPVSPSIIGLALRHTMKVDLFGCLPPIPSCPLLAGETPGWALHGRM